MFISYNNNTYAKTACFKLISNFMLFPSRSCGFFKRIQYKYLCRPALPMMALTDTKKNRGLSGNEYLYNI